MTGGDPLDGRRGKALREEMLRRAAAMLAGDGTQRPAGEIAQAIIGVAARIEEEVTWRLDRVPDKQTDNFFNAMGIGRDPARPAQAPVAFRLTDPAPDGLVAPASTRLMASGETGSVVFETSRAIALAPGSISALVAVDAATDEIFRPPEGVVDAGLPRQPPVERTLTSGAGAATSRLQISLATGLAAGTILAIGTEPDSSQHEILAIEGDLVTVDPPLDRTLGAGTAVLVVTDFAPFEGQRDRQSHSLYLGHETLLNLPSALSLTVTGVPLPPGTQWSWWGETKDRPLGWQELVPVSRGARLTLAKAAGAPARKEIRGRETLWLRAHLPGPSAQAIQARDIRLSVPGEGAGAKAEAERGSEGSRSPPVEIEAIANTTPVVLNSAFHPFGREPRLFDSFYVGCAEAFSKPGAEVNLRFEFAGPELGPLAAASLDGVTQIFGVGKDGLLYRAQLGKDQPRLVPVVPSREDMAGIAVEPQAPVAALRLGKTVFIAIAAKGAVHLAQIAFDGPLEAGSPRWKPLVSEAHRDESIVEVALVKDLDKNGEVPKLLAQTKRGALLVWTWPRPDAEPVLLEPSAGPGFALVPVQGADAALIVEPAKTAGPRPITFEGLAVAPTDIAEDRLPAAGLAAWAYVPPGTAGTTSTIVYLAGTDEQRSKLQIVRLGGKEPKLEVPGKAGRIAFEPPPRGAAREDFPTILIADPQPRRLVFRGAAYDPVGKLPSIEEIDSPGGHFVLTQGWIVVHGAGQGLLHRPATADGRWADEFDLAVARSDLALASRVPADAEFAAWSRDPRGSCLDVVKSATSEQRLLIPSPASPKAAARSACFFRRAEREPGTVTAVPDGRIRLIDDRVSEAHKQAEGQRGEADTAFETARKEHERVQGEEKAALANVALAEEKHAEATRKWSTLVGEAASLRAAAQAAQAAYETATALRAAAEAALETTKAAAPAGASTGADPVKAAEDDLGRRRAEETASKTSWETADRKAAEAEARASVANAVEAQAKATASTLATEAASLRTAAQTARGPYDAATTARVAAETALAAASGAGPIKAAQDDLELKKGEETATKTSWEAAAGKAAEAEARGSVANASEIQARSTASTLAAEATPLRLAAQAARGAYDTATAARLAAEAALASAKAVRTAAAELTRKQEEEETRKKGRDGALDKAKQAEASATEASEKIGREASEVTRLKAEHRILADRLGEAAGKLQEAKAGQSEASRAAMGVGPVEISLGGLEAHILLSKKGSPPGQGGIWRLTRASVTDKEWDSPGFPNPEKDKAMQYQVLAFLGELPVSQAVEIAQPANLQSQLAQVASLHSNEDPAVMVSAAGVERFDERWVMPFPARLVLPDKGEKTGRALLTTKSEEWSVLGPRRPPNPALSWEYWNGSSWWALDSERFVDRTANLLLNGAVFFLVPPDLEETEVGGRKNHWIRARLVGGDYGEAQVTMKSVKMGEETVQRVERDMTTVRAPYVTSLSLGFSASTEVAPEIVLTEDSLGPVDQTSANMAGLPVAVFTPLGDVMDGRPTGPASPPRFGRGLMIGFDKPVRGDPVSLYIDAAPGSAAGELTAETLRDGRFQMVGIRDETHGLSEPGMIQLSLDAAPDQTDLLGATAYWVRLSPRGDGSGWSPRIRGIYLNAVRADSVETREMESLGHSSGIPGQSFRLAQAPVAPESLELRVRETLGEEDLRAGGLDVLDMAGTMPGPWVRWREVDDLGEAGASARMFVLDAESGGIRFGDGRQGAIPPLGAELLALRYQQVAGAAGNAVAAGAALQLLSPVANVERVTALDAAAGGSDVETAESARRRGSAKLRHGDRILTLADLEDYVRARSPTIAQVRAANRRGAVRLVVAATGAEARPGPATLRALEKAVRSTAGYRVAGARGLSVVPPRLLPLRVEFVLDPDDPDRFIEMADIAEAALVALFDPAAGGFDGQGWPIGRLPVPGDVAAALEPVSSLGVASGILLLRADRRPDALPASLPADVLVRLDRNDVVALRRREAAA